MPYGARFINGKNVTVIDENNSVASYSSTTFQIEKDGPTAGNRANYFPTPAMISQGIVAIYMDSDMSAIRMMPTSDTGGVRRGHVGSYQIQGVNTSPGSRPCKLLIPMSTLGSSNSGFGLRIWNEEGQIAYDSGHNIAQPVISRALYSGNTITIPNDSYIVMCSWYMHWSGTWRVGGNLQRLSRDATTSQFLANHFAIATSAPGTGTYVGTILIFDNLP